MFCSSQPPFFPSFAYIKFTASNFFSSWILLLPPAAVVKIFTKAPCHHSRTVNGWGSICSLQETATGWEALAWLVQNQDTSGNVRRRVIVNLLWFLIASRVKYKMVQDQNAGLPQTSSDTKQSALGFHQDSLKKAALLACRPLEVPIWLLCQPKGRAVIDKKQCCCVLDLRRW